MRGLTILTLAVTAMVGSALAADAPAHSFQPRDLFSLENASDPQISPGGGEIAYVRISYDIMIDRGHRAIWLIDTKTGTQEPMASSPGSSSHPRWSPDGTRIAYVSQDENGHPQLFVHWMKGGVTARLADLPSAPSDIAWSPNGRQIAFTMNVESEPVKMGAALVKPEGAKWAPPIKIITRVHYREDDEGYLKPGYSHIFVVPSDGGAPRQLTFGDYDERPPLSWTPDSQHLLFSSNRAENRELDSSTSQIYQIDVNDGSLKALTDRAGPNNAPTISPDGSKIAWVGYIDKVRGYQNSRLYVMNRDGTDIRSLTDNVDRSLSRPRWGGNSTLYVQYEEHGVGRIASVSLGGHMETVAEGLGGSEMDRPYAGGAFSVNHDGDVAFTKGDATHPADVALAGGRKLTALNTELFEAHPLARVEHMAVTSSFDKRPLDAWVIYPQGYEAGKKYPTILEIHGGPFAAYGPNFASELQLYASAGYAVIYMNPRGSTSYGDEFANTIDRDYPSHDYDDLMSGVDALIAKGVADPDNLFVTGGSGGGVLTAWIVGKTDRFKAAVAQKPVINWTSEVLTVDAYTFMAKYWFGKMPWEDQENYWRRSPLSLVGNVKTPTMLMVGEDDHRTPPSEAEQFFQALQLRGIPTRLIRVPGASHEELAERPSQEAEEAAAILAWFGHYRTDKPAQKVAAE